MFILERLIGVGTFFAALLLCCGLIQFTRISCRKILGGYLAALVVMGFFFVPYSTADLYRIHESMALFAECSFAEFASQYLFTSTAPVSRLLYWIIGKTGVYGLLPAIAALVTYSCIFYIVIRTGEHYRIARTDVALTVLFLMASGSYMMVISNIRNMMAVSIICFCFYRERVENRFSFWHVLLYGAAALMHNMGMLVLMLRLSVELWHIKPTRRQVLIFTGSVLAALAAAWLIAPDFVEKVISKVIYYFFESTYTYVWEYISGGIILMLEFYILYQSHAMRHEMEKHWFDTRFFLLLCLLAACVLCGIFTFFIRFSTFIAPILTAPLLMLVLKRDATGKHHKIVFALSAIGLFLACARGQLCSLKFFVFPWNA